MPKTQKVQTSRTITLKLTMTTGGDATDLEAKARAISVLKAAEPNMHRVGIDSWRIDDVKTRRNSR